MNGEHEMHKIARIGLVISLIVLIASCATQPVPDAYDVPGFWSGILHGFISPLALIGGLFADVRIYAFPNSGWWYDLGFVIGAGSFFGSAAESV
jgi:hypothetical protein